MKAAAIITNLSILLMFVVAALLNEYSEALYYLSVQEDELLEWATFWGFMVAAAIYFCSAYRQFKTEQFKFSLQMPWFVFGLGLFCLLVAMEEISWGQRLLGYRAPDYFLEQNFQQELNLHNIMDTSFRKLVMKIILLGYGVVLSVVSLWKPVGNILARIGIVAPSPVLIVSFLAMYITYTWYPWSHTGEWVELAMAFGFAYAALFHRAFESSIIRNVLIVFAATWALAGVTVGVVRFVHAADPERLAMARQEIEALQNDFTSGRVHTRCGIHKRLYTFVIEYQQAYLLKGEFSQLLESSGNDVRAEYLLDPWNSAYWIRHKCRNGREAKFVYSFGPDRKRDSNDWEIGNADAGGDDIGVYMDR
jgi:hypothetical protein